VDKLKAAVLISGRGSNLQALLDASAEPDYPARIIQVIADVADAQGLERACRAGVATQVVAHRSFADRAAFDAAVDQAIRAAGADIVCLAGFMRVLGRPFVDRWRGRLLNIHPSLLPSFPGLHTHRRALEAGVKVHGCTVHFVTPDLDQGPIIVQAAVPVLDGDDEARLANRVLAAEHRIYPLALRLIGEGRVSLNGPRVRVQGADQDAGPLINPAW
jgi:phosphoribosylglycinamide formyltransferase-1